MNPSHETATMTATLRTSTARTCNVALRLAATLLVSALAACGGDGGADDLAGPLASPSAVTTTPAPASAATCQIAGFQEAVMAEVNRRRATAQRCGARGAFAAAGALRWNDTLFTAAANHARDMVQGSFFAHTGSNGSLVSQRVEAAGYAWASVAENIAAGQPTVARVVDAWMGSDGHCANLMNPVVQEVAVACVTHPTQNAPYWVMVLAKPR